jgi:hypothetical protein
LWNFGHVHFDDAPSWLGAGMLYRFPIILQTKASSNMKWV